jgi:four helix bundle protein
VKGLAFSLQPSAFSLQRSISHQPSGIRGHVAERTCGSQFVMRDFRVVKVWQRAHALALAVYREAAGFPADERFGLAAHLRKTALSVPSNIAEGFGRQSRRDLGRFLSIAAGSASELDYQLLLAFDLSYLARDPFERLNEQTIGVRRMLFRFLESIEYNG